MVSTKAATDMPDIQSQIRQQIPSVLEMHEHITHDILVPDLFVLTLSCQHITRS